MHSFFRWLFFFCMIQWTLFAEEWNIVYLASFPRSGNHWVRFLVEEATHIATSSVYPDLDFPHLKHVFPWGGYCTNHGYEGHCRYPTKKDPVLLKTHYPFDPALFTTCDFSLIQRPAICLIRHPVDAFWSFYVYIGKREVRIDKKILMEFIQGWKNFYTFWECQPEVLFIRYEDLHADPEFHLNSILQTAGFSFTQVDVERAVNRYSPKGMPLKHSHHYDAESIAMIQTELADFLRKYYYELSD